MAKFTIYGRPGCGYCSHAVSLMKQNNFDFEYIDIWAENISKEEVAKRIGKPVHTVPQILHGAHYVGGCTELMGYVSSGKYRQFD